MLQRKQNGPFLITAFGCLVALLVGCSASTGTLITGTSPDFTGASTATGSEVSASVGSMTMVQSSQSAGALANIQHSVHPDDAKGIGDGCGTVVVNSTNGQGAVTDETITYALPACEFTGIRGLDSLAITGDLELTQPDPPAFSFSSKATSLEFAFTASGLTSSETRNGTRQLTATQNILNESNDMTTVFQKASAGVGTLNNSLAFSFTPAAGSTLAVGSPLPSGTLEANGTVEWTPAATGSSAESFTVSTITPLAYDPACVATSASPCDSGQLTVVIADESVKTYAHITWTACAAPVVAVF
jgi:hypothetical protein